MNIKESCFFDAEIVETLNQNILKRPDGLVLQLDSKTG